MKNTHRLGALNGIALGAVAIASVSIIAIFALPTLAQESPDSGERTTTPVPHPRNLRSGERLSQQQVTDLDPQNFKSPEAVERKTIERQEAYIQQIEWRQKYGDLDLTPGRF